MQIYLIITNGMKLKKPVILFILTFMTTTMIVAQTNTQQIHVVLLGDSNTWLGGDNCDKDKGWSKWFNDKFKSSSCRSYARSGATWTNTLRTRYNTEEDIGLIGDDNVIYNQVNRLIEDTKKGSLLAPNLLIIAAGTNDAWFEAKRPHAFSTTPLDDLPADSLLSLPISDILTLRQSVRYSGLQIRQAFPETNIVLLTPLQSTAVDDNKIRQAGDIIEQCGEELGLFVIRQDEVCCVKSRQERLKKTNTYDGTHTNAIGAKKNGYLIAKLLNEFLLMDK